MANADLYLTNNYHEFILQRNITLQRNTIIFHFKKKIYLT